MRCVDYTKYMMKVFSATFIEIRADMLLNHGCLHLSRYARELNLKLIL